MSRTLTTAASFVGTVLSFALLALVLLGPGSGAAAVDLTPAPSAPVAEQPAEVEEAFIADLYGPGTDVTPEDAAALAEVAQRICYLLSDPTDLPAGAEIPTRESMVETFTLPTPSLTTGWTEDEANKFIDVALATYCSASEQDASL